MIVTPGEVEDPDEPPIVADPDKPLIVEDPDEPLPDVDVAGVIVHVPETTDTESTLVCVGGAERMYDGVFA